MIRVFLLAISLCSPVSAQEFTLPDVSQIRNNPRFDLDWVPPPIIIQALAAAEDPTWFDSFPANSPITRQVAKAYIPDGTRTITRRMMEVRLAIDLANEFTPDEIISMYTQTIWLGARCFGMQNALEHLMDRTLEEATLQDAVTLAALIRAPMIFSRQEQRFSERFEHVVREGQAAGIWRLRESVQLIQAGPTPLIDGATCPPQ